jgi:UDP-perosamine 4-acetyltransferase
VASEPELPLLIIGAGGHAKVVIELIRAENRYRIAGLLERSNQVGSLLGIPVIGTDLDLSRLRSSGISHAFVAIGDNELRLSIGRKLTEQAFETVNAISPAAIVSPSARLGRGIAIMGGVVVSADAKIDDFVIVNTNSSIDHDCHIEEAAHIAPGCALAGSVRIGRLTFLGTGTNVIPQIVVGQRVLVGAGSCVIDNVPDDTCVHGVPAKIIRSGRNS